MTEESSRLLANSKDFYSCSIAKNDAGYTPNKEYIVGSPDTISDGDNRGRDPEDDSVIGSPIGTNVDIKKRNDSLAFNACMYTKGNEYNSSNA